MLKNTVENDSHWFQKWNRLTGIPSLGAKDAQNIPKKPSVFGQKSREIGTFSRMTVSAV